MGHLEAECGQGGQRSGEGGPKGWGGKSSGELELTSEVAKIAKAANGARGARGHEDTERGDTAKAEGLWRRLATVR